MGSTIKDKSYICHLTALDNLESIIEHGLSPRSQLNRIQFVDTANHEILIGRDYYALDEYVPFHFHHHTSYDTIVKKSHLEIEFIYLCIYRSNARQKGFLVLPIHPTSKYAVSPLSYDVGFNQIDWNTMEMNKGECDDENYRIQVRMAECIHKGSLDISDIDFIFCRTYEIQNYINEIFNKYSLQNKPNIMVNTSFFEPPSNTHTYLEF